MEDGCGDARNHDPRQNVVYFRIFKAEFKRSTATGLLNFLVRFVEASPLEPVPMIPEQSFPPDGGTSVAAVHQSNGRNLRRRIALGTGIAILLVGLGYGFWQEQQYQHWKNLPHDPLDASGQLNLWPFKKHCIAGLALIALGTICSIVLGHRQRRRPPVSLLQRTLLASVGLLTITVGVLASMVLLRLYIWTRQMAWPVAVGCFLGIPFLSCWAGGVWVSQAVFRFRAAGAGVAEAAQPWLPSQPLAYSTGSFVASMVGNLAGCWGLSYLAIPTGQYDDFWRSVNIGPPDIYICLRILFIMLAVLVSLALWHELKRQQLAIHSSVSMVFRVWCLGTAFLFSVLLPTRAFLLSLLCGMTCGIVLMKTVKIRKVAPAEQAPELVFGNLFTWDRRASFKTFTVVVATLLILSGFIFRKLDAQFLVFSAMNALWPVLLFAGSKTTGKVREFFLGLMIPLLASGVVGPLIWQGRFALTLVISAIPIGIAAGWILLRFSKIVPKVR